MRARKTFLRTTRWAAAAGVCAWTMSASALISDVTGFIVQRDTEANDPGGTATQAYELSNLVVTNNGVAGGLTIFEDSYDNEPAGIGFSGNRTNSWFTANGTDRFELDNAEPFELWVTINLDAGYFNRNNRKEAGIRFQNANDPAANSLFIITTDTATAGQVASFGSSGAFFPLTVFDTIDPVIGVYEHATDARLGFIYTPPGPNIVTNPATYEFVYDPGADGLDVITSGPLNAANFGGFLTGSHIGFHVQNNVADGSPFGDATTFADEFINATFSDIVIVSGLAVLNGDYNDNGQVEQGDLDLVLLNWGADGTTPPAGWTNDLPTGLIDQAELDGVLLNWGATSEPAGSSVPEPASALLAVPLLALCLQRRARVAAPGASAAG